MMDQTHSPDWRPTSSLDTLRLRSEIYRHVREFFYQRNVLEVDTPILSQFGNTDPHIESFIATANVSEGKHQPGYLHTSPEFAMKRLLAAGTGSIYQLCKVFRHEEYGRYHNPEFSMLEWYRLGFTYHELMDEVAELVSSVMATFGGKEEQLRPPVEKISYQQAFLTTTGLDPSRADAKDMADFVASKQLSVQGIDTNDRETWLDLILGQFVQPQLGRGRLTFIYDFPENRAALAKIRVDSPPVAERFELIIDGMELANGYQELLEPGKMLQRFTKEQEIRVSNNQLLVEYDKHLIAAGDHGLPECAGVALGMDRLILLITKHKSIKNVLAFCCKNA